MWIPSFDQVSSIEPEHNNPAKQALDGVDVYLEHETRFELATLTLAKGTKGEE